MSVLEEVRSANASYAASYDKGDLAMPPARRFAVLTCMDARIDPARATSSTYRKYRRCFMIVFARLWKSTPWPPPLGKEGARGRFRELSGWIHRSLFRNTS